MTSEANKPVSPAAHTVDATAAKDDLVGTMLGHYRVVDRLGQGGMGVVYRAEDEKLRRTVALKVLPDTSSNEERRQRFLREARSAAAITHPNVAVVYAVDEAAGRIYIAMELVEGENLRARLDRGRLDVATTKELAGQIARGLAAAHDKGIVHRDLKPENVMITPAGIVKLLDFGLAKAGVDRPASGKTEAALARTETLVTSDEGRIMGTPEYMSPEQAMGEPLDLRSDVFSFGIVLYEMLAGTRPFSGASTGAVLVAIARDEPRPLRERAPEVDEATGALVMRCLAKSPAQRPGSAGELVSQLSGQTPPVAVASITASTTTAVPSRRRGALVLGVLALIALAAAAIFVPRLRATGPTAAPSSAPTASSAAARPTAVTSLPPPKTGNPEAAKEYASAMQSLRDASLDVMTAHLQRALELDPDFAAAHLRLIVNWGVVPWSMEDAHRHLAAAVAHRSDLDARDLALLEEARPVFSGDMWDPAEVGRLGKALAERFPMDAEMLVLAGASAAFAGQMADGLALIDRAAALDPEFAVPDMMRAFYQLAGATPGGHEGALAASNRCLSRSPSATSCLGLRADLEARSGQCSALELDARRMLALQAGSGNAYAWLADALVAQDAPPESIAEAQRRAREHVPAPAVRALLELLDPAQDALLRGDFASTIAAFPRLDAFLAGVSSDSDVGNVLTTELMTLREVGQLDRAVAIADAYMKRQPALTQDTAVGARPLVLAVERLAHRLSDAEFDAKREAWTTQAKARMPPLSANVTWLSFYAQTPLSPRDARSALDALPRYSPLPSLDGNAYGERMMGQTLLLAGRVDDAIPHLRGAVTPCFGVEHVFSHNMASELLGEALESKGDRDGACAAYAEVLRRWGHAKPRSVTADAARAHATRLGCAP